MVIQNLIGLYTELCPSLQGYIYNGLNPVKKALAKPLMIGSYTCRYGDPFLGDSTEYPW